MADLQTIVEPEIDAGVLSGCMCKVPFRTRQDAQKALNRIRSRGTIRNHGPHSGQIYIYQCNYCGHFHHGHEAPTRFHRKRVHRLT